MLEDFNEEFHIVVSGFTLPLVNPEDRNITGRLEKDG